MELLKSASAALQRHKANVALYVGATVFLGVCTSVTAVLLRIQNPDVAIAPTLAQRVIQVALLIGITAGTAIVQTIAFSRIGRELDRPLWKVADDREALRRFFTMWFEFNLIVNTLIWLADTLQAYDTLKDAAAIPVLLGLAGALVLVPFGAALMFHGNFSWDRLGEGLGPIGRRLPQLAPVFLISLAQILIWLFLDAGAPETDYVRVGIWLAYKATLLAAIAYLDCLVFAAVWLICKTDRDSPDEIDLDF